MTPYQLQHGDYVLSTDPARLEVEAICGFLARSYWADKRPRAVIERSLHHSLCFGIYTADWRQVGLARIISDYATFAYVCDVFINEQQRGHGLGKWLMASILSHPDLQGLRRWTLATRDAHGLYQQFDFNPLRKPENWMERFDSAL